jgi:hypothetical protein
VCHHAQHPDRSELGGKGERVGPDDAREFVASNHRAVPITRRSGGELQTSPVLVRVDPSHAPSFLHGQGGSWSWPATGVEPDLA